MKNINYIFALMFTLLFFGCEQIDVIESSIPYQQFNIVNGRLLGDSATVSISFTKSFPIEANLSRDDVALKDVNAYIWSETQGIFPLIHDKDGIYLPVEKLTVQQGVTYELFGNYKNERIYSITTVPKEPEIAEAKIEGEYLKCKIIPNLKSVYAAKYRLLSLDRELESYIGSSFYEVTNKIVDASLPIEVRTSDIPIAYFENPEKYKVEMILYSFDDEYRDYFSTRENNKPIENIFSEGGGSVYWNVYGENTIGLFMGYTKTKIEIEQN